MVQDVWEFCGQEKLALWSPLSQRFWALGLIAVLVNSLGLYYINAAKLNAPSAVSDAEKPIDVASVKAKVVPGEAQVGVRTR